MTLGILGGTFDPIHQGHLVIARAALDELALDRVLFLPDGDPPHKQPNVSKQDRLIMTQLACADEPRYRVSDMELRRRGRTYTVDTLVELTARGEKDLVYLVGSDTLALFPTWRTAHRVAQLCRMAVVLRPGDDRAQVARVQQLLLADYGLESRLLHTVGLDISSSMVRQAITQGQAIDGLVPAPVAAYIAQNGLYTSGSL
ncbi:MAG: nicotinate (nicotinamide) nucleotide adenylyltransferase [Clostridiales bacterium]|nr:nicotinate (nicotinamide) nucleotide adenylyltransferase [Clostridiales bacterium]